MSNTLQDIVLIMFHDAHTDARTDAWMNRTKAVCLRPHYVGWKHKKQLAQLDFVSVFYNKINKTISHLHYIKTCLSYCTASAVLELQRLDGFYHPSVMTSEAEEW